MNEEEIVEFIDQLDGVKREYKHKPILTKNVENIGIAIQSALNLYQHEKEKNKKLEEDKRVLEILEKEHKKEIDVREQKEIIQSKVIDMMAEDLTTYNISTGVCLQYGKYKNISEDSILHLFSCESHDRQKCKECIREYYFKKARGEEDEKTK